MPERTDQAGGELLGVDIPRVLEAAGYVPQALAVAGPERVDVADRIDPVAEPRGDAGDDHSAVGMAGQDEAVEARVFDLLAHVVDVVGQGNAGMQLGLPRAEAAERSPRERCAPPLRDRVGSGRSSALPPQAPWTST